MDGWVIVKSMNTSNDLGLGGRFVKLDEFT